MENRREEGDFIAACSHIHWRYYLQIGKSVLYHETELQAGIVRCGPPSGIGAFVLRRTGPLERRGRRRVSRKRASACGIQAGRRIGTSPRCVSKASLVAAHTHSRATITPDATDAQSPPKEAAAGRWFLLVLLVTSATRRIARRVVSHSVLEKIVSRASLCSYFWRTIPRRPAWIPQPAEYAGREPIGAHKRPAGPGFDHSIRPLNSQHVHPPWPLLVRFVLICPDCMQSILFCLDFRPRIYNRKSVESSSSKTPLKLSSECTLVPRNLPADLVPLTAPSVCCRNMIPSYVIAGGTRRQHREGLVAW